jgi:hypothetical protein
MYFFVSMSSPLLIVWAAALAFVHIVFFLVAAFVSGQTKKQITFNVKKVRRETRRASAVRHNAAIHPEK